MGSSRNWSELLQNIGIIVGLLISAAGFLLAAYTTWRDGRGRQTANSIAIKGQHWDIWKELFTHPQLKRVCNKEVHLDKEPVSIDEKIFVTSLILHLDTSFRAAKRGEFIDLERLPFDVKSFFSLPIPRAVWNAIKSSQEKDFVSFIESNMD